MGLTRARSYDTALWDITLKGSFKVNSTIEMSCTCTHGLAVALPPAPAFMASFGLSRRTLVLAGVLACMTSLQGCRPVCEPPEPQLAWRPDTSVFNERTRRIENGIWRGNPSWVWSPQLESEDYHCMAVHPNSSVCLSWTSHEWSCEEEDFGMCKCYQLSLNGQYCEKWSCHSLEADQQICQRSHESAGNSDNEDCHYAPFRMDYDLYNHLMELQAGGSLGTGETIIFRWWAPSSLWSSGRRMTAAELLHKPEEEILQDYVKYLRQNTSQWQQLENRTDARRLATHAGTWPPVYAYSPAARHAYFHWGNVCIVNGDNRGMARKHCSFWREIETEIQMCECKTANIGDRSCARWICEGTWDSSASFFAPPSPWTSIRKEWSLKATLAPRSTCMVNAQSGRHLLTGRS